MASVQKLLCQTCEVHLGIVANSKMANVAVIRSTFGFICIGNARIHSECSKDFFDLTEGLLAHNSFVAEDAFLVLQAHIPSRNTFQQRRCVQVSKCSVQHGVTIAVWLRPRHEHSQLSKTQCSPTRQVVNVVGVG